MSINSFRVATNSKITLCGCASEISPAYLFPPPNTDRECLKSKSTSTPVKRSIALAETINSIKFTCNLDLNKNPFQDCLNAIGAFCDTNYIGSDSAKLDKCKYVVDKVIDKLSDYWKNVRRNCGKWSWYGTTGSYPSDNCKISNIELQKNVYYINSVGTKVYVGPQLAESINIGLWENIQ